MSLDMPHWFWTTCATLLGLSFGSFAGLVVYRLPRILLGDVKYGICYPASHCVSCSNQLRWWQNIPVISYVSLRGRCDYCGTQIGLLNLIIEIVFALLWGGFVAFKGVETPSYFVWLIFLSVLVVLLLIDWQAMLLPDLLTLPLLLIGVICAYVDWIDIDFSESILGAFSGYIILFLTAYVFERMRGTPAMGGGDMKLTAALGAWLGAQSIPWLLLIASTFHILFVLTESRLFKYLPDDYALKKNNDIPESAIPFGPGLVIAAYFLFLLRL